MKEELGNEEDNVGASIESVWINRNWSGKEIPCVKDFWGTGINKYM